MSTMLYLMLAIAASMIVRESIAQTYDILLDSSTVSDPLMPPPAQIGNIPFMPSDGIPSLYPSSSSFDPLITNDPCGPNCPDRVPVSSTTQVSDCKCSDSCPCPSSSMPTAIPPSNPAHGAKVVAEHSYQVPSQPDLKKDTHLDFESCPACVKAKDTLEKHEATMQRIQKRLEEQKHLQIQAKGVFEQLDVQMKRTEEEIHKLTGELEEAEAAYGKSLKQFELRKLEFEKAQVLGSIEGLASETDDLKTYVDSLKTKEEALTRQIEELKQASQQNSTASDQSLPQNYSVTGTNATPHQSQNATQPQQYHGKPHPPVHHGNTVTQQQAVPVNHHNSHRAHPNKYDQPRHITEM